MLIFQRSATCSASIRVACAINQTISQKSPQSPWRGSQFPHVYPSRGYIPLNQLLHEGVSGSNRWRQSSCSAAPPGEGHSLMETPTQDKSTDPVMLRPDLTATPDKSLTTPESRPERGKGNCKSSLEPPVDLRLPLPWDLALTSHTAKPCAAADPKFLPA